MNFFGDDILVPSGSLIMVIFFLQVRANMLIILVYSLRLRPIVHVTKQLNSIVSTCNFKYSLYKLVIKLSHWIIGFYFFHLAYISSEKTLHLFINNNRTIQCYNL